MSEMVERCISAARWSGLDCEAWASPALEELVRKIIAAMREPTDAMGVAGHKKAKSDGAHDCEVPMTDVWRAMIDAALAD
jgi:hypothetical protein